MEPSKDFLHAQHLMFRTTRTCCGDLRHVIDYLLVSVFGYFGDNTHKKIEINMSEKDEQAQKLRSEIGDIPSSGLAPFFEKGR
jgi:hypothetical protein